MSNKVDFVFVFSNYAVRYYIIGQNPQKMSIPVRCDKAFILTGISPCRLPCFAYEHRLNFVCVNKGYADITQASFPVSWMFNLAGNLYSTWVHMDCLFCIYCCCFDNAVLYDFCFRYVKITRFFRIEVTWILYCFLIFPWRESYPKVTIACGRPTASNG